MRRCLSMQERTSTAVSRTRVVVPQTQVVVPQTRVRRMRVVARWTRGVVVAAARLAPSRMLMRAPPGPGRSEPWRWLRSWPERAAAAADRRSGGVGAEGAVPGDVHHALFDHP